MNFIKHKIALVIFSILIISSCVSLKPEDRLPEPVDLPAAYILETQGNHTLNHWWQAFESRELNSLVEEALDDNLDIRSAWARLRQAEAEYAKSASGLFPDLNVEGDIRKSQTYRDNNLQTESKQSSLGLAASYELDLWSKIRSQKQAERLNTRAARQDVQAAAISVAAEVVNTWLDLLAVRQEISIVKEQIEINKTLLDLLKVRFENGMANALNVSQQREVLAASRSELPQLKASEKLNINRLALLLGQADAQELNLEQEKLPELIPLPHTGLPAELLSDRPDVRAAFLRLKSSDLNVVSAKAERLPAINISASSALSSDSVRDSFSLSWGDWVANLAANLSAPVFDAGRRKAEVERTQAVAEERLVDYTQTVLQAIKEVQDALVSEVHQRDRVKRLEEELQAAEQAQKQARLRYIKGLSDYLDFLTELKNVQTLQRQILNAKRNLVKDRVALYRSLGGDWTEQLLSRQSLQE